MVSEARRRKNRIRLRDRKKIEKKWLCDMCHTALQCQLHHLSYHDKHVREAVVHLCEGCHPVMDRFV